MIGDSDHLNFPGGQSDRVQGVVSCRAAAAIRNLEGGEVDRRKVRPMGREEPPPVVRHFSLGCRWDAVSPEHVADRAVADVEAEVDEAIPNRILAPLQILARQANDQVFRLAGYARSPAPFGRLGHRYKPPMPSAKGVNRDDQLMGFQDPSIEIAGENGQDSPLVRCGPGPFSQEVIQDAGLLVQEID